MNKNIFGEKLEVCGLEPLTGYFRNGCCDTDSSDAGLHTVCVIVTEEFLYNSKLNGNDLTTPVPEWGFPGLKVGDKWCLCATRWRHAQENGYAPNVVLEATNEKTLSIISAETLIKFSHTK